MTARTEFRALRLAAKKAPHGMATAQIAGRYCLAVCHVYGHPTVTISAITKSWGSTLRSNLAANINLAGEARRAIGRGHHRAEALESFRFWMDHSRATRATLATIA